MVASVSCIYGLGLPETYMEGRMELHVGQEVRRDDLLRHLVTCHYERNDVELMRDALPEAVGVKAAGGVRTLGAVQAMIGAGAARVGTSSAVSVMAELAAMNGDG